jgi:hypothetical protein
MLASLSSLRKLVIWLSCRVHLRVLPSALCRSRTAATSHVACCLNMAANLLPFPSAFTCASNPAPATRSVLCLPTLHGAPPSFLGSLAKLANAPALLFDLLLPICPASPVVRFSYFFFFFRLVPVVIPAATKFYFFASAGFFPFLCSCWAVWLALLLPMREDLAVTTLHQHQCVCCSLLPGAPKNASLLA